MSIAGNLAETVIDEAGNREKKTSIVETTVGRALLQEILPEGVEIEYGSGDMFQQPPGE